MHHEYRFNAELIHIVYFGNIVVIQHYFSGGRRHIMWERVQPRGRRVVVGGRCHNDAVQEQ